MKLPDGRGFRSPNSAAVQEACARTGLLQLDLAERLGVTDRALRAWRSGETPIPYSAWYCLLALAT